MKNIFLVFVLALAGFSAQAQETSTASTQQVNKYKNARYDVTVSGNCDQCKKRIEKAAFSVAGVKLAAYDINEQMLHLIVNEEKTSVAEVEKAVAKVGHDTENVKASDYDYDNLHHCCKYERK